MLLYNAVSVCDAVASAEPLKHPSTRAPFQSTVCREDIFTSSRQLARLKTTEA